MMNIVAVFGFFADSCHPYSRNYCRILFSHFLHFHKVVWQQFIVEVGRFSWAQ